MKDKILSIDVETDGLWGRPFSIAAITYERIRIKSLEDCMPSHWCENPNGYKEAGEKAFFSERNAGAFKETNRVLFLLPEMYINNEWVKENVLPTLEGVEVTHTNYESMLKDFAAFYMENKKEADVICHMGYIVEAFLFREMHRVGAIGDWDAPYPLLDISGNLQAAGEESTSVDVYAKKHGLEIADYGTTHNPLYDCEVAAKVYMHLVNKETKQ